MSKVDDHECLIQEVRDALGKCLEQWMIDHVNNGYNPYTIGAIVIAGMADAVGDLIGTQEAVACAMDRDLSFEECLDQFPREDTPIARKVRQQILDAGLKSMKGERL